MSQDSAVLQRIPSLGDVLGVSAPPPLEGKARRVSPMGPPDADETNPKLPKAMQRPRAKACPPLPPAPEGITVPKGVYDRTKAKSDSEPKPAKVVKVKTRKAKKARKVKADKVVARLASTSSSEPNFVVDDAGRIAIIDGTTRIDLSIAATKRLVQFMDRTKSFRA